MWDMAVWGVGCGVWGVGWWGVGCGVWGGGVWGGGVVGWGVWREVCLRLACELRLAAPAVQEHGQTCGLCKSKLGLEANYLGLLGTKLCNSQGEQWGPGNSVNKGPPTQGTNKLQPATECMATHEHA